MHQRAAPRQAIAPRVTPVLFVTYSSSSLWEGESSETYRKLQGIIADLSADRRSAKARHAPNWYKLVVLYQRNRPHEQFNCSRHVPELAACAEYTREDMKREFGHTLALHRRGDAPRRLNVGFWVCALWMLERSRAGSTFPHVWYIEDDVYLPRPWPAYFRRYDARHAAIDLLTPQRPYFLKALLEATGGTQLREEQRAANAAYNTSNRGWERHQLDGPAVEFAIARGRPTPPTQLSIPTPTLAAKLPVNDDALYAKVPLYAWRLGRRLVRELVLALERGARAHEEIFVPTACQARLREPPCAWETFEPDDVGIPCGTNQQDSWFRANYPAFRSRLAWNLTQYQDFIGRLQRPGGVKLLPTSPQRMYHPVKGQLTRPQNALTLREAGGV
ncbi:hypothetical protein AB1Y20_003529 [Prymnesium parvum]|uniref:Uncharacterized protein n=1 Tax=Prymnesium parvum TaxID=97485 RepID=A0AB34J6X7_PRYPA